MGKLIRGFIERRKAQFDESEPRVKWTFPPAIPKITLRCVECNEQVSWEMGIGDAKCLCGNIVVITGLLTIRGSGKGGGWT